MGIYLGLSEHAWKTSLTTAFAGWAQSQGTNLGEALGNPNQERNIFGWWYFSGALGIWGVLWHHSTAAGIPCVDDWVLAKEVSVSENL